MQATYDAFVEKAAAGRNTTPERIDAIAQGRVWTGQAGEGARARRRARRAGSRARARQGAREDRARTAEVELVVFPPKKSLFEVVSDPFGRSDGSAALGALLGTAERAGRSKP